VGTISHLIVEFVELSMRFVSLILIGLVFWANVASAEMSFKATVDRLSVAYEDKIHLQLEVKVSDPATKTTPIAPPEIIGLQIGGSGSSVERQGELIVRRYSYELVPGRSGSVTIPAFRIEFQSGGTVDTLTSEPITVEIAQPKPVRKPGSFAVFYFVAATMIIIAVALLVRRRRAGVPSEPVETDWRDEYRQRFAEVKKLAERQDFRSFSTEIMRLVVAIVEQVYETKVSGQTSSDLLRWLGEKNVDKESLALCKDLFDFCEGVKFSSGKVDVRDGTQALNRAETIVELLLR
jgi:hypothetical protein